MAKGARKVIFTEEAFERMTLAQKEMIEIMLGKPEPTGYKFFLSYDLPAGYIYGVLEYDGDRNDFHCGISPEGIVSS